MVLQHMLGWCPNSQGEVPFARIHTRNPTLILSKKSCRITFLALQWMICQAINKSELWVFEKISRKLQNSKNSHKNFCPNFWDRHRGSFFLFFHPDNESSEKKTFAEGGYGSTVSYPTIYNL